MKVISLPEEKDAISLNDVDKDKAIFVKDRHGKLHGLLVKEDQGWIVRCGGELGSYGHYGARCECIKAGINQYSFTFHVED